MSAATPSSGSELETIALDGRLDALTASDLRIDIQSAIDGGATCLIVDLEAVTFVDSAGLAALAKGMKQCRRLGGDLRLVTPSNPDAMRVFQLTRFDQVFRMGATHAEVADRW